MNSKITYHQQVSYCGKLRCRRCREGIGHGPYWYAYQTVNGRTIRTYIGKNLPSSGAAQGHQIVAPPVELIGRANQSTLVGREYELRQMRAMLHDVHDAARLQTVGSRHISGIPLDTQRQPQFLLLNGAAGIGKTRLAEEIGREALHDGWTVVWSRQYEQ